MTPWILMPVLSRARGGLVAIDVAGAVELDALEAQRLDQRRTSRSIEAPGTLIMPNLTAFFRLCFRSAAGDRRSRQTRTMPAVASAVCRNWRRADGS